jgi:hypothetical protein
METLKKKLGVIWIAIGLTIGYFNVVIMGLPKLQSGKQEDLVFAIINLAILTPIIVGGLLIFGYYSLKGEYQKER